MRRCKQDYLLDELLCYLKDTKNKTRQAPHPVIIRTCISVAV